MLDQFDYDSERNERIRDAQHEPCTCNTHSKCVKCITVRASSESNTIRTWFGLLRKK